MIPAIDPGFGLKEDRPIPRTPPPGDSGFAHVLQRTTDPEQSQPDRSVRDARPPGDPHAREAYGRRHEDEPTREGREADDQGAGQRTETTSKKANAGDGKATAGKQTTADKADGQHKAQATAGKADGQHKAQDTAQGQDGKKTGKADAQGLQAAAKQVLNPALQAAMATQPAAVQGVPQPGAAGLVPTAKSAARFAGADDATPIDAQIGLTDYKLSPHGKGEAQAAEANGVILPGTPQAKLAQAGADDAKLTAFQKAQNAAAVPAHGEKAAEALATVVQASQAHTTEKPGTGSYKDQIALQTAQARNEVLSRLAATGADTTGQNLGQGLGQGTGHGDAASLRQQLQIHGLLARDARLHTLEPTSPNAPQTAVAGLATATNAVPMPQPVAHDDDSGRQTIEKVASEARWLINNNRQEVTLRLSPAHLGNLHLKVQHEDGVFHIHLTVDSAAAKHLLESNLQDLRNQLLGDHPNGQFFFNVDVRHGNDQPGLYQRSRRPALAGVAPAGGLEPAAAPALARRMVGQSGLNIYA